MKKAIRILLPLLMAMLLALQGMAATPTELVPVGSAVGLELESDGVYVVRFAGEDTPAEKAGLQTGDRVQKMDGKPVSKARELADGVQKKCGEKVILSVLRDEKEMVYTVYPEQTDSGWRIGVYVRDSIAGIGTVTFYDPATNTYGALGHGVNEIESATLLPIRNGTAISAEIVAVVRGKSGAPGELKGAFSTENVIGTVEENTCHGIFGTANGALWSNEAIPVAKNGEITTGNAEILANVDGTEVQSYCVQIKEIYPEEESGRNLLIQVTDPALLERTGGIVQGM